MFRRLVALAMQVTGAILMSSTTHSPTGSFIPSAWLPSMPARTIWLVNRIIRLVLPAPTKPKMTWPLQWEHLNPTDKCLRLLSNELQTTVCYYAQNGMPMHGRCEEWKGPGLPEQRLLPA